MKKSAIRKFFIRVVTCWRIMTRKYDHWVLLNIDDENLIRLLKDKDFEVTTPYHGTQPYVYNKMIQMVAKGFTEVDTVCAKAEFEAAAQEYINKTK